MRFFWTGETKNFKPIHVAIFLFTVFVFLFWIGAFVHFGMKFGYSVEKIQYYFWGEPDFPSEVSIAQVLEESHVNLFVVGLLFLCISALVVYSDISPRLKFGLMLALAFSGLLYAISDLIIIFLGREYAVLKLFIFLLFQAVIFLSLLLVWFKSSRAQKNKNSITSRFLAILIFIFAIFNLVFAGLNFTLFANKIGFTISNVSDYYLGNPEKFLKLKSISGLVEIAYIHFLPMALYLITLVHFVYIVNDKFNIALTILMFISALLDNFGGILITQFGGAFAGVKLFSFFTLQFLLLLSSAILIYKLVVLKFSSNSLRHHQRI